MFDLINKLKPDLNIEGNFIDSHGSILGKHKGIAIADIPNDYKRWLLNQDNIDPYLIQAFEVA